MLLHGDHINLNFLLILGVFYYSFIFGIKHKAFFFPTKFHSGYLSVITAPNTKDRLRLK